MERTDYCQCGIEMIRWFPDIYFCPRCPKIVMMKGEFVLVWSGSAALVLASIIEREMTRVLLNARSGGQAVRVMPEPEPEVKIVAGQPVGTPGDTITVEELMKPKGNPSVNILHLAAEERKALLAANKKITECVQCDFPVEDKCGAVCGNCKTIQPCSRS